MKTCTEERSRTCGRVAFLTLLRVILVAARRRVTPGARLAIPDTPQVYQVPVDLQMTNAARHFAVAELQVGKPALEFAG